MNKEQYDAALFPDLTERSNAQPLGNFPKLQKCINSAVVWHAGQDRKYTKTPYITHPLAVMEIVRAVTDDEDMLCAAVLHDVVEDTLVEIETIDQMYGKRVAELVGWLTDVSKPNDGNRAIRKAIDRQHSADAPPDAQTIKYADLIHNTRSITEHDPDFARIYMKEKEALLGVMIRGDKTLYARALKGLQDYQTARLNEALKLG